jgi:hypothetical protein
MTYFKLPMYAIRLLLSVLVCATFAEAGKKGGLPLYIGLETGRQPSRSLSIPEAAAAAPETSSDVEVTAQPQRSRPLCLSSALLGQMHPFSSPAAATAAPTIPSSIESASQTYRSRPLSFTPGLGTNYTQTPNIETSTPLHGVFMDMNTNFSCALFPLPQLTKAFYEECNRLDGILFEKHPNIFSIIENMKDNTFKPQRAMTKQDNVLVPHNLPIVLVTSEDDETVYQAMHMFIQEKCAFINQLLFKYKEFFEASRPSRTFKLDIAYKF